MKNMTNKTKIIIAIVALIIIAGIVVIATKGFNFDLRTKPTNRIQLYIQKEFDMQDIKNIVNEVMPNEKVMLQKVELFEDSVAITANEITDEQKQAIIDKVNEKYELEISADSTVTQAIPNTRLRDLVKPFVLPFALATAIALVYMAIRYRKQNAIKVVLMTLLYLVVAEAVLISLIAITRVPMGRVTMPAVLVVYVVTLWAVTAKYESALSASKAESEKKN